MLTKVESAVYESGGYYRNVYVPRPMDIRLSRLWMTRYYKIICKLFPKFRQMKNETILEIGSGFGGFINLLSTLGYRHLTASDICQDIYHADSAYPFKTINIEKYQGRQKYNTVVALDVMEHLNHPKIAIKNIERLLDCRGYFIFCVPYPLKKHLLDCYHTNMQYPNFYTNIFHRYGFRLYDYKTVSFIPFFWRFGIHFSFPGITPHPFFITETFFVFQKG